ncbi:MAG TPA: VTT domain-containing protein [Sphingobium sp.]|nr:VTT domain-containing protein [Sphingobium sp.]
MRPHLGQARYATKVDPPKKLWRWALAIILVLTAILVPFLLWETSLSEFAGNIFEKSQDNPAMASGLIVALLAGDVLLPVPSSLLSAFAGGVLGFWPGALVIWIGMNTGCIFGYLIGRSAGRVAMVRLVGDAELARARHLLEGTGAVALIVTRAVPVLAEMLVLGAGAARMRLLPFLILTSLANAAAALAYAALGAYALSEGAFLLLFLGLAALPALGWLVWRWIGQ